MEIEITDYSGRTPSSIRIPELRFIGLIHRSSDNRFGLASGKIIPTDERLVLYLCDGLILWRLLDLAPMEIRFFADGWGCFTYPEIGIFNPDGIVFRAEIPKGFVSVRDVQLSEDEVVFYAERFIFKYNWLGDLIEQIRDDSRLFVDDVTDRLRWDRYNKAEALMVLVYQGNAKAAEDAEKLLNICSRQFGDYLNWRAKCFRLLGELALISGNVNRAIEQWRTALKADPKVGVKRKLQILEKSGRVKGTV